MKFVTFTFICRSFLDQFRLFSRLRFQAFHALLAKLLRRVVIPANGRSTLVGVFADCCKLKVDHHVSSLRKKNNRREI